MWPALQVTKALGGSATVREMNERVVESQGFSEEQQDVPHGEGRMSELEYRLHWARTHLKGIGALENSSRGVWAITEHGRSIGQKEMQVETKKWRDQLRTSRKAISAEAAETGEESAEDV